MDTIQTPRRIAVFLVIVNVQLAREGAILNVRSAPLATTSNLLQLLVLLVLLNVSSVQEETIPNVPTAPLATISNPLQLLV